MINFLRHAILLLGLVFATLILAQESPPPLSEPLVKKIAENQYKIGEITFHSDSRQIQISARVNMTEGLLEYILVHENGKIHESLFTTTASPLNLNVALKLLKYSPSQELFPLLDKDQFHTDKYPEVPEKISAKARLQLSIQPKDSPAIPLGNWITHRITKKKLASTPWLYTGSYIFENAFKAENTGDFIAIFTSQTAVINYSGKERNDDTIWIPTPKLIPPLGTPVTLIIQPFN